jgi:rhomboid protease GluP
MENEIERQNNMKFAADRPTNDSFRGQGHSSAQDSGSLHSEYGSTDDSPFTPAPLPYATIIILVLITAIYVAMEVAGHGDIRRVALEFGAKDNGLIKAGQYWRFVTPIFLHGGWLHLLVNGFSLYRLGGSMERIYGPTKYLLVFILAGIAGNMLSYLLSPTMSLGASGALFGLVGAGLVFPVRFRSLIPVEVRTSILRQLIPVAVINLAIGFSLQGIIDNWAHIGGLLGGGFVALFLIPDVLEAPSAPTIASRTITTLAALSVAIVIVSWIYQWNWARANPAIATVSYAPVAGPAWWTVAVPARWRYSNGAWQARDGASIHVFEHLVADPVTRYEIRSLVAAKKPYNTEIDGKPGWFDTSANRMLYLIPVYDRLFELTMENRSAKLSPQAKSDFARVAGSVRFILPPMQFPAVPPAR